MLNPETGMNETKTYALALVMTDYMEPGSDVQRRLRERALSRLVRAVREEAALRGYCRDVSLEEILRAATRR